MEQSPTVIGKIRKNTNELLPQFIGSKGKAPCNSIFGFQIETTIKSYIKKKREGLFLFKNK